MNKKLILIIVLVFIVVAGGITAYLVLAPKPTACTLIAKICPDGSIASSGPNCEFICPDEMLQIQGSGGFAMLPQECTLETYKTEQASYIIQGSVTKVESKAGENGLISTYSDIKVEKYIKGEPISGKTYLQIVTPGGSANGRTQAVEDQPIFTDGKRVKIYLKDIDGELMILCGVLGVAEVDENGEEVPPVPANPGGITVPVPGEESPPTEYTE